MNPIFPMLAKAAGVGALLGGGLELMTGFDKKGALFLASVITSVALRALAYYLGVGTAVGALVGIGIGLFIGLVVQRDASTLQIATTILGGALIGATLGYLAEVTGVWDYLTTVTVTVI